MAHARKATEGQRKSDTLTVKAWNDIVDATNWGLQTRGSLSGDRDSPYPHPTIIELQNSLAIDLAEFSVLSLGAPIVLPTVNLPEFQFRPNLIGILPPATPDPVRFAVLQEPIPSTSIGRAAVSGATAVQVNFGATTDTFARPAAGITTNLVSDPATGVPILWPAPSAATGLQWALVLLGGSGGGAGRSVATIRVQVITASGTYVPSSKLLYALVELVGGGAGGGGATSDGIDSNIGGGGGSGGYCRKLFLGSQLNPLGEPVLIGQAGLGASGVQNGGGGGTTSFGVWMSATGGGGGQFSQHITGTVGGIVFFFQNGGIAGNPGGGSGGDVNMSGYPAGRGGGSGIVDFGLQFFLGSGNGGSNPLGSGGTDFGSGGPTSPSGFGSGGSGQDVKIMAIAQSGRPGAAIVTEYLAA